MSENRKLLEMNVPMWFDGKSINEALFCEDFLRTRQIIFANGAFFTPDGRVTDDLPLRGEIFEELKYCAVNNIPRKISNIIEIMKLAAHVEDFPPEQDRIHLANGTLMLDGTFTEGKPDIVRNRLPVFYPHYRHDEFVDVTDEVWAAMYQAQREMENYERRKVYHRAYYSLDAYSWLENYALEHSRSPEDILLEREEMTTRLHLIAALPVALAHATPTQARRVHAYYIAGIKQPEISRIEGVHSSKVSVAIRRGLRNMRRCYDGLFQTE